MALHLDDRSGSAYKSQTARDNKHLTQILGRTLQLSYTLAHDHGLGGLGKIIGEF